jgi:hypothetical protein
VNLIAIDPGPTESAYAIFEHSAFVGGAKVKNETLVADLPHGSQGHLVIERIRSYGMPAGAELFETCEWSGRFWQAWLDSSRRVEAHWLPRKDVKLNLCGNPRAKDGNIRQAILDRFGGRSAIGTKKAPGPLYGVSGDVWAALAVGLTWMDLRKAGTK